MHQMVNCTPERLAIAPLTGWAAARVEHQVGASVIGATATAVERDVSGPLSRLLPRTALVGGGDARLRSDDGTYEAFLFGGVTACSVRRGDHHRREECQDLKLADALTRCHGTSPAGTAEMTLPMIPETRGGGTGVLGKHNRPRRASRGGLIQEWVSVGASARRV